MRWLYIVGGLLVLIAFMIFSAGSFAGDRLGVAILQIGGIALVGAAVAGGINWHPGTKTQYQPHPAGWYTDPNNGHLQRWWDGQRWTERTSAPE